MTTQRHWVEASNEICLFVQTWGNSNNTPIVLVHGYPDSHTVWEAIAEQLSHDFYVVAYDVRGAGKSSVPKKLKDYKIAVLAQDLVAVVNKLLPNRQFHLAAHDWGSIQSWESVTTHVLEGRILSYTTLSGPSLDHAALTLRKQFKQQSKAATLKQLAKSWYIAGFHLPLIAPLSWKLFLGKNWHQVVDRLENTAGLPENPTQTTDGVQGINLYRANFVEKLLSPQTRIAHCPVQVIILEKDAFVSESYMQDLGLWVKDLTFNRLKANHWAILSRPDDVAQLIKQFAQLHNPSEYKQSA